MRHRDWITKGKVEEDGISPEKNIEFTFATD